MRRLFILLCSGWVLCGCHTGGRPQAAYADTLYMPAHARGFAIYGTEGGSVIEVTNPWQGAQGVNHRVFIPRGDGKTPAGFEGVALPARITRVACMSSSHIAFMEALGAADAVRAVSGIRYITNDTIRARGARGEVRDVGYEGNIDYELLLTLRPDVVLMYSVAGEKLPAIDKMKELGVPVVMIGEYLEPTPLGKAEWAVVFGEMFGCRERGEAIFEAVRRDYEAAQALAAGVTERPGVMLNAPWKDTWFVPGDRSYMVALIRDAGGRYVCEGVDSEQSRAIGAEQSFVYASGADFWLSPNDAGSMADLLRANPGLRTIPPVVKGRVWNNTLRSTPGGGSDFWESGTVYPNLVLRDMIAILHPELLPGHRFTYFRRLE